LEQMRNDVPGMRAGPGAGGYSPYGAQY
jgi:hypothetical protein